jgi:ferredoxin
MRVQKWDCIPARKVIQYARQPEKEVQFMAYKINDECIACGACESECPVEAISEGDGKYEIDAEKCISCGACASVCPVSAPEEE